MPGIPGAPGPQQQEGKDGAENWMAISIPNNDRGNVYSPVLPFSYKEW